MLIFNAIQHEIAEIRERIEILGADSPTALRDKQRLDLLLSMEAYIQSLVWVQKERDRPIFRDFIVSQHDYHAVAEKYQLPLERVYALVNSAAEVLNQRLSGVLAHLQSGNLTSAEDEFYLIAGHPQTWLLSVHQRFRPLEHQGFDIAQCEEEIHFLQSLSQADLMGLGQYKMEHLLYILFNHDNRYLVERTHLYKCFSDIQGVSETLVAIKEYQRSKSPIFRLEE
jgi:hypothetical protein